MELGTEETQIQEINNLKGQLKLWRWGLFGVAMLVALTSIGTINSAFHGLVDKGPKQEQFVTHLSEGLRTEVAPMVEDMAKQTLNEVQPEVNRAIKQVNERLPELAQATLSELDTLQVNLPKRGEAVLTRTFGQMLVKKEDELQKMFPEATDEQIDRLLTNLAESSGHEASDAAVELFGHHHDALMKIHDNLEKIRNKEAASLANVDPTWETGLLVLDLFRKDLENMRDENTTMATASSTIKSAKTVKTVNATKPSKPKTEESK